MYIVGLIFIYKEKVYEIVAFTLFTNDLLIDGVDGVGYDNSHVEVLA